MRLDVKTIVAVRCDREREGEEVLWSTVVKLTDMVCGIGGAVSWRVGEVSEVGR